MRGPREGFDVSFYLQTLWIQASITLLAWFIILWGLHLLHKLDEDERGDDDG